MNLIWLSCLLLSTVLVNGNLKKNEQVIPTQKYLLTIPQIFSPTGNQICLTSANGFIPEEKDLYVTVYNAQDNEEILSQTFRVESDAQCFRLDTESIKVSLIKIKLQLKPYFDVERVVEFMPSYGMTMIETSKPVYQPGEKLQFRAIGFDGWMRPWSDEFLSVSVYNPENVKVMEWQGKSLEKGLKHYEMPIAKYNREGVWNIVGVTKSGETIQKSFQVSRKVQPEVVLKVTKGSEYILSNDETHRMVACAEDSQGVRLNEGLISVKIGHHYIIRDLPIEDDGCVHFTLKNETLRWSPLVGRAIHGSVEYQNKETNVYANLPLYIPVVRAQVHLRVPSSAMVKNYFKPGLPYFGYLIVERPDYTPLPNAEVDICYKVTSKPWLFDESDEKICQTFTSTSYGIIEYVIPPVSRDAKQIMIEATIPGVADHKQNFVIHPWADQTPDQFIIKPIVRVRSCNRAMPEATKYTVLMTRNGTSVFDKLYLQSTGRVSAAKSKAVKLSPTPYTPESGLTIGGWPESADVYFANVWEDVDTSSDKHSALNRIILFGLDSRGNLISDSLAYLKDCLKDETLLDVNVDENNQLSVDLKAPMEVPCSIAISASNDRGRVTEQKIAKLLEKFDDIYAKGFEWDRCSLELKGRASRQPLMIDFKNNWDTFKEMGLRAFYSHSDIFNKPCEWDQFDDELRNKSLNALLAMRHYLPYPEHVMTSLADSADMAHLTRLENSLVNDLLFWGSRQELDEALENFNPSLLEGKSAVNVHALCMDPIKGIRSYSVQKPLNVAPIYIEHDLPSMIFDKAIRNVNIYIKRRESSFKQSECIPVELDVVNEDESFELLSELPKLCSCTKVTRVTLEVKPLKKGPLNLKVIARFVPSLVLKCNSENLKEFKPQQSILKTNVATFEPKVTERVYDIICSETQKTLLESKNDEKIHVTRDLVNIFMKQFRDDIPIRRNILEILSKLNALTNLYIQNEGHLPASLSTKVREAILSLYQELALFRLADGSYSFFGGNGRVPSLVATTFAYKAIAKAQAKLSLLGGSDVLNPTFDFIIGHMDRDGCFRSKHYANITDLMYPFDHHVSQKEMTAFIASALSEAKQTPKIVLRRAMRCLERNDKEESDYMTRSMTALLYAKVNRANATKLIQELESERQIPKRFMTKHGMESREENIRAKAYFVMAKLALNQTDSLRSHIQELVRSNISLHDPVITTAVTMAWAHLSKENRPVIIKLDSEKISLKQFEMKKVESPKKKMNWISEGPGCALLERVQKTPVDGYYHTYPVLKEESREDSWETPEGEEPTSYMKRGFKILKGQRDLCQSRITICPMAYSKNSRFSSFEVILPVNYEIDSDTLYKMVNSPISQIENFETIAYNKVVLAVRQFTTIGEPIWSNIGECFDVPMRKISELIDDAESTVTVVGYNATDLISRPFIGSLRIEKECSMRVRRNAPDSSNAAATNKQTNRSANSQVQNNNQGRSYDEQQQQAYEPPPPAYEPPTYQAPVYEPAPVKGYAPPPPPPAYTPPAYEAPAYEPAPVKGYAPPPPPPTYAPPAYEAPAYAPPAYAPPAYAPPAYAPPAYEPPTYQAPVYEPAPVKGYAPPPPPPAYEPPTYQAPAYEPAPVKGYAPPPPPAYAPPAYEPPTYQAPVYEPAPVKGYAPPPPPPAYTPPAYAPPAYEAPAYQAPAYEPAPVKGYAPPPPPPAYAPPPPPAYAPPAYEAPAYQAPAYEPAPVKGYAPPPPPPAYAPPPPPAYAPPAYEPPTYQAPAYEPAPVKGYAPPPPPAYAPPAYEAPAYAPPSYAPPPPPAYAPPAYEAPAYQAPAYEPAPVKGYAPPPPPAYAPPPPPAYAPPAYEAPAYQAPAYEPAKGYAPPPPAYAPPPPVYEQAPAYRDAQGRSTSYRYGNSFASNNGQQARNPTQNYQNQPTQSRGTQANGQWSNSRSNQYRSAPQYQTRQTQNFGMRYVQASAAPRAPSASTWQPVLTKQECEIRDISSTCPVCQRRVNIDMIDNLCNNTVVLSVIKPSQIKDDLVTCGKFDVTYSYGKNATPIVNEPFSVKSGCTCDEISTNYVIMVSNLLNESTERNTIQARAKALGEETVIVPATPENVQELSTFFGLCQNK